MTTPLVIAYGAGVDSTALLIGLKDRGIRPDLILFADTGDEKAETYAFIPIMNRWLESAGFPTVTTVRYRPVNFKHWPPYETLGENCLTNGTLPSLAFGFKSCSLKWKVDPQNKFCNEWAPAVATWNADAKVRKMIGYDASPKDRKRFAHAIGMEDAKYDYSYPLIEWNWNREACKRRIFEAGLPVPPKSACVFCPATKPAELHTHRKEYLRLIVMLEARAEPRLKTVKGLWRKDTKGTRGAEPRPGKMTDYIRANDLLSADEIDRIITTAPADIISNQKAFANGLEIPSWHDFLEAFSPEDYDDEPELIQLTRAAA